jgi:molybdopterin synthase sulfur carrier subunit
VSVSPRSTEPRGLITVRYFAAARAAAGVPEEQTPAGGTLTELAVSLADRHGPRLEKVLAVSSFLVDGVTCHDRGRTLPDAAVVDVLPPFAGG